MAKVYTVELDLNFDLVNRLSKIDRFSGAWADIERKEGVQTLRQLKLVATVQSVGASTRIEGAKMTNDEVRILLFENLKIDKLEERDQQEIVGYFQTLNIISESYHNIRISEGDVKNLHNHLMRYSDKDEWYKGDYKQQPNSVDAHYPDGTTVTIFKTALPGFETADLMRGLFNWYDEDTATPAIIKTAVFVYEFLSIHPFQDGNGRLSRLLGTLLLLKQGYPWIQYVSFEHEIEQRKQEYYEVLMNGQQQRPGENIQPWLMFFLSCLTNIQQKLMQKLEVQKSENKMSPREKMIYTYISNHPGTQSSEVASALKIPLPTVKRLLSEMTSARFLNKYGVGAGTNYTTERLIKIRSDIMMKFTAESRLHEFQFKNKHAFIEIKKIILQPKFKWTNPDEWGALLINQSPVLNITCRTKNGKAIVQQYAIAHYNNSYLFNPVFTLNIPIHIPENLWEGIPNDNEFPINVNLEVECTGENMKFDILLVYDTSMGKYN
jgi:Fic family protein